jgi:hypothetical protein
MNFVDLISIDDLLSYLLDYCNFGDIISLYVLFLPSSRSPLSIPKYVSNIHWCSIISPKSEGDQILVNNIHHLNLFFNQCFNLRDLYLYFYSEMDIGLCELTLQHLLSMNLSSIKNVTIIIPEEYPTHICNLCSHLLQKFSATPFHQIESIIFSFPAYKVDGSPHLSLSPLNIHSRGLVEIYGLESFDNLFEGISHPADVIAFLDLKCWPNLQILHLGNLIARLFLIIEDTSENFSNWSDSFLSKFTTTRFPSVSTLDFDSLEDQQFLTFISSLAAFIITSSQEDLGTYLWSSISKLIFDRFPDQYPSANRFALEEEWMSSIRGLRSLKSQSSSESKRNDSLPSQSVLTLFPNISTIHLCALLPSSHFLTLSSACSQLGLRLQGFSDDPILHQYLATPSLHPSPVGITHLSIFERFCDFHFFQQRVPSFEKCRLLNHKTPSQMSSSVVNHSFLDTFLSIVPKSSIVTHLTPLSSKRLALSRYLELNQFLKYNSSSLSYLHINESHLRNLLSEWLDINDDGERKLFGNCHVLQIVIIELDLFCRGEPEFSAFESISRLIQCLRLQEIQQAYSQLRRIQLNVWTHGFETALQSFLLPQLDQTAAAPEGISIYIRNRSGDGDARRIGRISCFLPSETV